MPLVSKYRPHHTGGFRGLTFGVDGMSIRAFRWLDRTTVKGVRRVSLFQFGSSLVPLIKQLLLILGFMMGLGVTGGIVTRSFLRYSPRRQYDGLLKLLIMTGVIVGAYIGFYIGLDVFIGTDESL